MPTFSDGNLSIKPVYPQIIPTLLHVGLRLFALLPFQNVLRVHLLSFCHMILQPYSILSLSFPLFPLYSLLHLILFQLLLHSQHKLQVCETAADYRLTSCSCFLSCTFSTTSLFHFPTAVRLPKPSDLFQSPLLSESTETL